MDTSQVQKRMHNFQPSSETSNSFDELPLSPLRGEVQPFTTGERFFHVPLEHEITASRSVWDDSANADEVGELQDTTLTSFLEEVSPGAAASAPGEYSLISVEDQELFSSETLRDPEQEQPSSMSTTSTRPSDSMTPRIASVVILDETSTTLDETTGLTFAVNKISSSTASPRDRDLSPSISESDISDMSSKFSDYTNKPTGPAEVTISVPSTRVISHALFSRAKISETSSPSSTPEFFEIPIPIFPFPAGTSRCNNRNCPIKGRHEQGPYLHEGKLRTREGAMFGSSNPPPEIWFLYDRLREENLQGARRKGFAPVELFAKFHFGETRGEYVHGSSEMGREVQGAMEGGRK
ncbi:MAG: hypothetical protein ALECFALPRED_007408 [Alectoria fallacina]|uniref:Uncharacterized protein n=1 Tax=Alectoria fallacina TaxID=1903189 RepID=A0A8H3ID34_9LECA|nr:MAG: hypothetical protein ALECFALPRED_007408 [Alectoria fallacina]